MQQNNTLFVLMPTIAICRNRDKSNTKGGMAIKVSEKGRRPINNLLCRDNTNYLVIVVVMLQCR